MVLAVLCRKRASVGAVFQRVIVSNDIVVVVVVVMVVKEMSFEFCTFIL